MHHLDMSTDASRALHDFNAMEGAYTDDADKNPINASYERPAMLEMAGDVTGKRVLDVGCAGGALSEALVARGASVVGIDVNERFIERARARLGVTPNAEFHVADIAEPMPFVATGSFDIVTASLVLHYVEDWTTPLREFRRVLRPDGVLLISTHHPTQDIELAAPPADYFKTTLLTDVWRKRGHDYTVRFYRRPLSAIVSALAQAGFVVERMPEPIPDAEAFAATPDLYKRMRRGPWFLFIRAIKRSGV